MKITVLTPTYRLLYKDMQIEALSNQTLKEFEWVVVDESYEENKGLKASFPIIHIPPSTPTNYFAMSSCMNDGLARASGKYVFFMNDYIAPDSGCLQRHWEVQERMGGCMLSGRDSAVDGTPATENGKQVLVKDYRMALFDTGTIPSIPVDEDLREIERVGVQNWWAGHNDSCPLETVLACNGFDEAFDGRWGGQDADLANRLMTYGLKYYLDKKSIVLAYSHPRGGTKKMVRTEAEQQSLQQIIIDPKVEHKIYTANTQWFVMLPRNMREEWEGYHK